MINKIIDEYNLPETLMHYFKPKDAGVFLDLAAYMIIIENNAGQYYPDVGVRIL